MLTKKLTRLITTSSLALVLLATPVIASAQTVTTTPKSAQRAANQAARLAKLHTEADSAIADRIASLNSASTRVNGLVKLSSDQKTQYQGEITADVNALTSLKTKADADTDIPTLRSDYRSIFTTYRIYAEFLPQLHLLVATDTMGVTDDKLSDLAVKLQSRIQADNNPSNLASLLSDMQTQVSNAKNLYGTVQSQITPLTPQSYDSNPTQTTATIKNARSEIKEGATDLKTAFSDAKQIVQALKASKSPTPTP